MTKPYEDKLGAGIFKRFEKFVKKVLAVPRAEIDKREAESRRTKEVSEKRWVA
jgi:hypothetical protein